jgi:two-component system chemotaxis response regulator CheB
MPPAGKTRVLVIDDSATARRLLSDSLRGEPDIIVVGEAADAFTAQQLIAHHKPDLVTLDIEMPEMDGLAFLRHLMARRPLPVIIVSSHAPVGSAASIEALRAGAIEVISKPKDPRAGAELGRRLKQRIRELRACQVRPRRTSRRDHAAHGSFVPVKLTRPIVGVIAIGTSAGGPQALEILLPQFPADAPPILIVQHMPVPFTQLFAERLNDICPMRVKEASGGETLAHGVAYLAPGDHHLIVEQQRDGVLRTAIRRGPLVHHQRPAVDVLFHSLARVRGVPIVGILLTGMGRDGADGMVALRHAGQETIAEDPRSCVVFGMPREAIARGGATHIATLNQIPATTIACLQRASALPTR